jgi:protein SCO1/2
MRGVAGVLGVLVFAMAGCRSAPPAREFELKGQILGIEPKRNEVTIKHEDIKNFMPGMTMPFRVKDAALLDGKQPGDLVTATLVVGEVEAHLSTLTKTGQAALETTAAQPAAAVLQPGDQVEDRTLVDQDGEARSFSKWRGHRVALTFMYTRCPLPEFCPRMDRQFATIQQELAKRPELSDVRLISMTLDPAFDTHAVLKTHARRLRANPAVWSFLTGKPVEANEFATQFGIYVEQNPDSAIDITHNLRTAIIDADGRLVKVHTGNEWTPADLVADLTATAAPKH